jgi:hypothetical protein
MEACGHILGERIMDRQNGPDEEPTSKPLFTSRRRRRLSGPGPARAMAVVAVLALVGLGVWWYGWGRNPATGAGVQAPYPDASPDARRGARGSGAGAADAGEPLPPLSASDELVRRLAEGISSRPAVAEWLTTDGLVRRFVVVVANVAQGTSPASHLEFMEPSGAFAVTDSAGRMHIDPAAYRRYDGTVAAFASLDASGVGELFRRIRPLCDEAYRELGLQGSFDDALAEAFGRLLAVRVPPGPVEVEPDRAVYAFTDRNLEALSPAAKQLLRMGPDNARRVQRTLTELAEAMGVEPRTPVRLGG